MTQGVNLLPARYVERLFERRLVAATAGGLLVLVLVLLLAAFAQSRDLRAAETQHAQELERTEQLRAERAELAPMRTLAERVRSREDLLAAAMRTEVSWAGVLAGMSAAFPDDASLTAVSAESTLAAFDPDTVVQPGDEGALIGSAVLNGYSVAAFSPGLAQLLDAMVTVTGLSEARLAAGAVEDIGATPVTTFDGTALLDASALTGRYLDGLPPEDDVEVPVVGAAAPAAPAGTAEEAE